MYKVSLKYCSRARRKNNKFKRVTVPIHTSIVVQGGPEGAFACANRASQTYPYRVATNALLASPPRVARTAAGTASEVVLGAALIGVGMVIGALVAKVAPLVEARYPWTRLLPS